MAYAAVISLKHTIKDLLNSSDPVSPSRSFLQSAFDEATTLQIVLERLGDDNSRSSSSERVTALEGQIRDCAHGLEDALEFNHSVEGEIRSFAEQVKRLEVEFIQELSKQADDSNNAAATDHHYFSSKNNIDSDVELVGYSSQLFITIRDHIIDKMRPDDLYFVSLLGEVGTGRTVVAKRIFEDREDCLFDCSAWVRVGAECELKEVLIRILAQVDNLAAAEYEWLRLDDEKVISKQLYKALKHRTYKIVMGCVHNVQLIECLKSSCPDQSNGSLVLFTSCSDEVAYLADVSVSFKGPPNFFKEKMWFLLRLICFQEEPISEEIEEAGMKIVQNCQGRAISVGKAYLFLDATDKSVEQWSKLAADIHNPIFMVQDEHSEVFEIKTKMQSNKERDEDIVEVFDRLFVGFYDSIEGVTRKIQPQRFFSKMEIISLMGMAGIGKTTLARKIYKDTSTMRHFDCHVWLTLGPKYQTEDILIDSLARIYPSIDRRHMKGDAKLATQLCEQLSDKRFLIVLDDLWSKDPLHHLKNLFPDIKGTTLVTTRLAKVAKFADCDTVYEIQLLNNEESWYLLREKVFAGGFCPSEFEEGGFKIAEICDGLPLLIATVAEQLLKVEITLEYWNNVASGKEKSVFMNAHHEISKALLPSYESLPQHLKGCFLYIGVFRIMHWIPSSKLINLLISEGFLETNSSQIMEAFIAECLSELVNRSLVLTQRKISHIQMKKCRHHSVFWHLCNSEAAKNKTFHAMNSYYADCKTESIKGQRRVSIRSSVLLGIKDVYNAMEESCLNLRSLLCTGLPHQYPVPLYFGSRLLRVLDALAIRFYEFPVEVTELIHLKYLGLTCNGKLPSSISRLWMLQHLIVSRYNTTGNHSLLPDEIWDMKELEHLEVMGGRLPDPKRGDGLHKLLILLDVSVQSCRKNVLKRIPNLKKLGIRIELAPDDDKVGNHPFQCLNHISGLRRLESLKCVVVNPHMRSEVGVAPPPPILMFPSSLKRLSLSGLGYPWEHMNYIGALENLKELKLKCYAFRGTKWDIGFDINQFCKLKLLLLEDTNLECWKAPYFRELRRLSIKHCYKLQELPISFNVMDKSPLLVEIVDCSLATMSWAKQIRLGFPNSVVDISESWIENK